MSLVILRAPQGTDILNHGVDEYLPHRLDGLFAVPADRVPYFTSGQCGCAIVDRDEARAIILARQQRELIELGLAP